MADHTLLIRNARLIDGSGTPSVIGDLAVSGDRITAMGDLAGSAADKVIDADGLALAPGFIDSHCHDDRAILDMPLLEPKVSQGVTTVINGNCGLSIAPVLPNRPDAPAPLDFFTSDGARNFPDFNAYFAALEQTPPAVNAACLCGHSNLRHASMDTLDRAASSEEIAHMCALLRQALEAGALGLSTGLYYPPATAAPTQEVIEISKILAAHGGLYVTHMRNEEDNVIQSLEETFRIGRDAGVPVIVSHHKCMSKPNHGKSKITLAMIDAARKHQSVGLDVYPYAASSTILQPERVNKCARVMITWSDAMPEASGRDLSDIAREMGCTDEEAARNLLPGGAVYFQMSEEDVQRILAYPDTMIGSDGIVHDKHPHPRAWGTFPRVLGHYARDEGLFPLETAVHKMTGLTAGTFGLADRGTLRPGNFADLVLFDPATILDVADFVDPCRPAQGIEMVFTNGVCTWKNGNASGNTPGRALRRS
jgi:N-acyl-D-amino-acid deacylase